MSTLNPDQYSQIQRSCVKAFYQQKEGEVVGLSSEGRFSEQTNVYDRDTTGTNLFFDTGLVIPNRMVYDENFPRDFLSELSAPTENNHSEESTVSYTCDKELSQFSSYSDDLQLGGVYTPRCKTQDYGYNAFGTGFLFDTGLDNPKGMVYRALWSDFDVIGKMEPNEILSKNSLSDEDSSRFEASESNDLKLKSVHTQQQRRDQGHTLRQGRKRSRTSPQQQLHDQLLQLIQEYESLLQLLEEAVVQLKQVHDGIWRHLPKREPTSQRTQEGVRQPVLMEAQGAELEQEPGQMSRSADFNISAQNEDLMNLGWDIFAYGGVKYEGAQCESTSGLHLVGYGLEEYVKTPRPDLLILDRIASDCVTNILAANVEFADEYGNIKFLATF